MTFDPEAIRIQIEHLKNQRDQVDRAIHALESALRNMEGFPLIQSDLLEGVTTGGITLHDAVKRACGTLMDGITRQRVIAAIAREHPFLKPKSSSVAASLINLTKGDDPMLKVAIAGRGRSPTLYSTQDNTTHKLGADEIKELLDPSTTRGTGGWQSLFVSLQKSFDKVTGVIMLTAAQRARIFQYYRDYGGGGWQDRARRIFRRELPHLFVP